MRKKKADGSKKRKKRRVSGTIRGNWGERGKRAGTPTLLDEKRKKILKKGVSLKPSLTQIRGGGNFKS